MKDIDGFILFITNQLISPSLDYKKSWEIIQREDQKSVRMTTFNIVVEKYMREEFRDKG